MLRMSLANLLQAIPHQQLIVRCSEDRRGHVHQDADPAVDREGALPEKDGGDDACAEVTGEVGADAVSGEAPHHDGIGDADREGHRDGRDKRVRGVEARPDDDADEAVHKEFLEEDVALVGLVGVGEGAKNTGDAAVEGRRAVGL